MGEARRKRLLAADTAAALDDVDLALVGVALDKVARVVGWVPGADCLAYALGGAAVLRHAGVAAATAVAGEAGWRVGPGSGDCLVHWNGGGAFQELKTKEGFMAPFHAWIEVGDEFVDFSTRNLRAAAANQDAADGCVTKVEWAPPYLRTRKADCATIEQANEALTAGVYAYQRVAAIEAAVFRREVVEGLAQACRVAVATYDMLSRGKMVRVVAVNDLTDAA